MPPNQVNEWKIPLLLISGILVSMIMFAAAVALLVFLSRDFLRKHKRIDLLIFEKLRFLTSERNNHFMLFVTFLGKHQFLIPANLMLLVYFLFIRRQTWFSIRVAAVALSSLVLMVLLKNLFRRRRPLAPLLTAARGLSFPSGHAIMSVTFYGLLIYILQHTVSEGWLSGSLSGIILLLIFLIGFSRVYLRVHYPSDVLAGFIIGLLWLFLSLNLIQKIENLIV
jgi:membrane-associated phospholipid phosphatase